MSKSPGDKLIGATLNTSGALVMRSERIDAQTMLAQIVQLVAQAQRSRAPMQSMADRVAGSFVLVVVDCRSCDLLRLGPLRARAGLGLRAGECRGGPHHRVPLCARVGDNHVHHGHHGQGRNARSSFATPRPSSAFVR